MTARASLADDDVFSNLSMKLKYKNMSLARSGGGRDLWGVVHQLDNRWHIVCFDDVNATSVY